MFSGGKSSVAAAVLAILTSLHFMEVDPQQWKAEESAVFLQSSHFLFQYLTDPINVPEVCIEYNELSRIYFRFLISLQYLPLVEKIKENRPNQKLSIGRGYAVSVAFPLGKVEKLSFLEGKIIILILKTVGQKVIPMRVVAMKSNTFVTLKGGQDFFLQPVFNLKVTPTKDDRRKITLQIHFDHKSMLFQVLSHMRFNFSLHILIKNFFRLAVYGGIIFTLSDGAGLSAFLIFFAVDNAKRSLSGRRSFFIIQKANLLVDSKGVGVF